MRDFFGCYLLLSLAPEARGRTYIGFTVNPRRRIRQHNGQIKAGAWKTSRGRPWEMTLVLYGFPTKIQALQFEWAWQHPLRSVIVRPIAQALGSKKLKGIRGQILLMLSMLHESPWRYFPLTLQYLDPKYTGMIKETMVSAPGHIRVFTAPMEELPHSLDDMGDDDDKEGDDDNDSDKEQPDDKEWPHEQELLEDEEELWDIGQGDGGGRGGGGRSGGDGAPPEGQPQRSIGPAVAPTKATTATSAGSGSNNSRLPCHICQVVIQRHILVCSACGVAFHLDCLAARWSATEDAVPGLRFGGVPEQGHCPACGELHSWMAMLRGMQTIGWGSKPRGRRGKKAKKVPLAGGAPADTRPSQDTTEEAAAEVRAVSDRKACKHATKPKAIPEHVLPEEEKLQEPADGAVLLVDHMPVGVFLDEAQPPPPQLLSQVEQQFLGEAAILHRNPRGRAGGRIAKARRPLLGLEGEMAVSHGADEGAGGPLPLPGEVQAVINGLGVAVRGPRRAPRGAKARSGKEQLPPQSAKPTQPPAAPEATACAGSGSERVRGAGEHDDPEEVRAASVQPMESPPKRQRRAHQLHEARCLPEQGAPKLPPPFSEPRFSAQLAGVTDASIGRDENTAEPSPLPLWQRLRVRAIPTAVAGASYTSGRSELRSVEGAAAKKEQQEPRQTPLEEVESPPSCFLPREEPLADVVILGTTTEDTEEEEPEPLEGARLGSLCVERCPSSVQERQTCVASQAVAHGESPLVIDPGSHQPPSPMHMDSPPRRLSGVAKTAAIQSLGTPPDNATASGLFATAIDSTGFGNIFLNDPGSGVRSQNSWGSGQCSAKGSAGSSLALLLSQLQCSKSTSSEPKQQAGAEVAGLGNKSAETSLPLYTEIAEAASELGIPMPPDNTGEPAAMPTSTPACEDQRLERATELEEVAEISTRGQACRDGSKGGHEHDPPCPRDKKVPLWEVVDLCTPLPLRSRLAGRAAVLQATAAAACPGMPWAAKHPEHAAGKRLRSPKLPTRGLTTLGGCVGGSDTHSCSSAGLPGWTHVDQSADRGAPGAAALGEKIHGPMAPPPVIERRNGSSAHARAGIHGEPASGGWSVSPWPLRQKRVSPEPALTDTASLRSSRQLIDSDDGSERRLGICQESQHVGDRSVPGDDMGGVDGDHSGAGVGMVVAAKGQQRDPADVVPDGGTGGLARFSFKDVGADDDVIVLD